jgi:NTP pyrophosphatase (non-canonical NTP hydrolase)
MGLRYLLLKLAEEAGEVVVAAVKYRLHRTAATQQALESEIGDLLAIIVILRNDCYLSGTAISDARAERLKRERKRMESR